MILLGALAAIAGFAFQPNVLTDNAAISFRYVDRIVAGHGFTYNDHEHFVRPDLEIARSRPGVSVTLSELPPPEPFGEDGGLQNVEVEANGALYAHPPSGATFSIKNKGRPVSLTFTLSFASDVPAEKTDGVAFKFWSSKEHVYQGYVHPDDSVAQVALNLPKASTENEWRLPSSPGLVLTVAETMIGRSGATYGS
jgi:hypothetical protein